MQKGTCIAWTGGFHDFRSRCLIGGRKLLPFELINFLVTLVQFFTTAINWCLYDRQIHRIVAACLDTHLFPNQYQSPNRSQRII